MTELVLYAYHYSCLLEVKENQTKPENGIYVWNVYIYVCVLYI
jgi:hypothetical protein